MHEGGVSILKGDAISRRYVTSAPLRKKFSGKELFVPRIELLSHCTPISVQIMTQMKKKDIFSAA